MFPKYEMIYANKQVKAGPSSVNLCICQFPTALHIGRLTIS